MATKAQIQARASSTRKNLAGSSSAHSPWKVIPANKQSPGALMGGFWVVMQAWPIANMWSLALLGPEGANITAGYGAWKTEEVPRDVGITEFTGRVNYEMDIDLLFDGWITHPMRPTLPASFTRAPHLPQGVRWPPRGGAPDGVWIEGPIKNLEALAITQEGDDQPHAIRIYGAVPHTELRWVIQTIAWGDSIRDKVTGRRMRQQATVHVIEAHDPTNLDKLPRSKDPKKSKKHKGKGADKHTPHKSTSKKN